MRGPFLTAYPLNLVTPQRPAPSPRCIKRRRASSTFRSFFFIAGRFFLITLRFVGMAALQRHVVVSAPPEPACRRAVYWRSNDVFRALFLPEREAVRFFGFAIIRCASQCLPCIADSHVPPGRSKGKPQLTS